MVRPVQHALKKYIVSVIKQLKMYHGINKLLINFMHQNISKSHAAFCFFLNIYMLVHIVLL